MCPGVHRFSQGGHFTLRFKDELLHKVTVCNGRHHLDNPAHLSRQVTGHEVHVVSQVFPRTGDAGHRGLTAELTFGADLAGNARHLGREGVQLIDHRVDGVLEFENFAFDVDGDLA